MRLFISSLLFLVCLSPLAARPEVTVSIPPLKTFVKKIAGETVTINVMVQPGHSPALYEPKPSQMRALARSDLFFSVGVPFETTWLPRFADQNPKLTIIDTAKGIEKLAMEAHHHHNEQDNHHEDHDHDDEDEKTGAKDPHVWLSPPLVKQMAHTILEALKKLSKENTALYEANYANFLAEIDKTDKQIHSLLKDHKGSTFMVFHPSWGYFAAAYGLKQLPIEIEGKEPSPSQLGAFIREIKKSGARVIFVQPEFSQKAARTIAKEAGVTVTSLSSLSEAWSQNLLDFAKAIAGAKR